MFSLLALSPTVKMLDPQCPGCHSTGTLAHSQGLYRNQDVICEGRFRVGLSAQFAPFSIGAAGLDTKPHHNGPSPVLPLFRLFLYLLREVVEDVSACGALWGSALRLPRAEGRLPHAWWHPSQITLIISIL